MWCWSEGREFILKEQSLHCIVYHYITAQWHDQFLQVGRLDQALILIGLVLCLQALLCLQSSQCYIYIYIIYFLLYSLLYLLVSWAWWDWRLTWLTNHRLSVLWHCWFGHLPLKIISKMTYNVSSGMLNPTMLLSHIYRIHSHISWGFFGKILILKCRVGLYAGKAKRCVRIVRAWRLQHGQLSRGR